MGYYYKRNNYNHCAYCGEECYYELCKSCYDLSKEDLIIKNEDGEWIKNVIKGNEYKFYDKTKRYSVKDNVLNNTEKRFYEYVKKNLKKKYTITPQVNLQTIIDTDTNTRNDELYRNIDFCIFRTKGYVPLLAIELNGRQHYSDTFWIERDKSIQKILESANLKLITIKNEELRIDKRLIRKIYNKIKHINSNNKKLWF